MEKIDLPNGCSCSALAVHPKNWKSPSARLDVDWYIHYRFYDSRGNCKQKIIRGVNDIKTLGKRREAIRDLLANELNQLKNFSFNPITNKSSVADEDELNEFTGLLSALNHAEKLLTCSDAVKKQITQNLQHINTAIIELKYEYVEIQAIKRKHVRYILDQVGRNKEKQKISEAKKIADMFRATGKIKKPICKGWTASIFNHYRAHLMMLFDILQELEIVELDLTRIKKKKEIKRIREVLTDVERSRVDAYLLYFFPDFRRFVHIFFHSGARTAELLRLKREDVDLGAQRYKLAIMKGRQQKEVRKTIKDVALPLWTEVHALAKPGDYLFGKGLRPGSAPNTAWQVSKRWRTHVKEDLRINAGFYSLKHLHTTQMVDQLSDQDAARHNSHTSTAMVRSIYDVGREKRDHDRVKKINNPFA